VNVPVFPVPDYAYAKTSFPKMIGLMAFYWIADGLSKP
jgi:hypothetical protein